MTISAIVFKVWAFRNTQRDDSYFEVKQIISDTPENLWARFRKSAGISESEFFAYYDGRSTGYAISIKNLTVLKRPIDPYKHFKKFTPPQSFMYVPERRSSAA